MIHEIIEPTNLQQVEITKICLGTRKRKTSEAAVRKIAESMAELGLRTPLTVNSVDTGQPQPKITLIAGAHRLAAAKKLGWTHINCLVLENEPADRVELWEISENLHRKDLSKDERDAHLAAWVRLYNNGVQIGQPNVQPNDLGVSAAAREFGVRRQTIQRAVKADSLSPEAKEVADAANLPQVARIAAVTEGHGDPEVEVALVQAEVARKKKPRAEKKVSRREVELTIELQSARTRISELEEEVARLKNRLALVADPDAGLESNSQDEVVGLN
jgi:ParB family chromosome partitioning protein